VTPDELLERLINFAARVGKVVDVTAKENKRRAKAAGAAD
jgi:hypothetical protein